MIVDCYTHIWDAPAQLGRLVKPAEGRANMPAVPAGEPALPSAGAARHLAAARPVDATIVLGFKSAYLDAEIPNEVVATYVRSNPHKLIGFAGIDPRDPAAADEIARAGDEWGMKGIAISPAAQDVHPTSSAATAVYERAIAANMPVLFHPGIRIAREAKLEYARPVLLDEVARDYPSMKLVIAHLGYPWVAETLVLLAKHENVFSDISWLLQQPWEAYQALQSAHRFGVMDKLLFASGFPYNSPAESIEALYGVNQICSGTNLPKIPREALRGIVECDALAKLGVRHEWLPAQVAQSPAALEPDADLR